VNDPIAGQNRTPGLIQPIEDHTDEQLVMKARAGESAAFDELVRRHRVKAFSWAARISKDPHLSEDIVQEALIRAFMGLGQLSGEGRFLGWLKGIVRNQALMRMRRGGPYAKELPMSSYRVAARGMPLDPYDLDSIMDYLMSRSPSPSGGANGADPDGDPQLQLERAEWYGLVRQLLRCLTARERQVFESHFFGQCSPQEIAELFGLSSGNVYQILSRSRHKVQEERVHFLVRAHIRQRREDGCMAQVRLNPEALAIAGGATETGTEMLHRFARARYPDRTLSYTNGFLLGGFLLNVEKTRLDMSSANMIDRNYYILNGMRNLGIEVRYVEAFDFDPPDPQRMTEAIALVQQSIDRGVPAMVWELIRSEFGLIYGYDDRRQMFEALDSKSLSEEVPYERLGRLQTSSLFVLGYQGDRPIGQSDAVWRLCRMVSRHARGGDAAFTGYANGLAAYDVWMDVFRKRAIEPLGHAYTIGVVLENRNHAAAFLRELIAEWHCRKESEERSIVICLLEEASGHYSRAAEGLERLKLLFPAPAGGDPADPDNVAAALAQLGQIRQAETEGVKALEKLASELERLASREHVAPIVDNPPRAYYM